MLAGTNISLFHAHARKNNIWILDLSILPIADLCHPLTFTQPSTVFESKKSVGVVFLHACARTDQSLSKIIIFKSAAGSISFRSTVSQSCSIHACVGGPRPRAGRASALRWRCRRLAAACPVRLVGDIRHATAVVHKVFGQENKPGAPVTSSQGARDTNVRPPNRAYGACGTVPL